LSDKVAQAHVTSGLAGLGVGRGLVSVFSRSTSILGILLRGCMLVVWLVHRTVISTAFASTVASTVSTVTTTLLVAAIAGLILVVTTSTATTTSSTATSASAVSIFRKSATVCATKTCLVFGDLGLLEGGVLFGSNLEKFYETRADVLLIAILVCHFSVFGVFEKYAGFSSEFTIWHFTNADGVLNKAKSMEELNNVIFSDTVGKTAHFKSRLVERLLLFLFLELVRVHLVK